MTPERMDVSPVRLPKRTTPINLLTGIFLKSVYFLDAELCKSVIIGIFKDRGDSLGVLFKGRRGYVYWSFDVFNQFAVHFNEITVALENNTKFYFKLDSGEDVKITNVFGKAHVFVFDKEHTLSLNSSEWTQFINNLPLIHRELQDLFVNELLIKQYITSLMLDEDHTTTTLVPRRADRLFDEIEYYKRWPNGGGN